MQRRWMILLAALLLAVPAQADHCPVTEGIGDATVYGGGTACNFPFPPSYPYAVAANPVLFNGGLGCGRCVEICPNEAIELTIMSSGYVDNAIQRLAAQVDVH